MDALLHRHRGLRQGSSTARWCRAINKEVAGEFPLPRVKTQWTVEKKLGGWDAAQDRFFKVYNPPPPFPPPSPSDPPHPPRRSPGSNFESIVPATSLTS